ncbi:hypothetical protein HPK19_20595 [Arthrobacter citreus]|nr:hypothetical protein HPK19_20595 [Arthrobacter citreus]
MWDIVIHIIEETSQKPQIQLRTLATISVVNHTDLSTSTIVSPPNLYKKEATIHI